jgi:hypothetical protein
VAVSIRLVPLPSKEAVPVVTSLAPSLIKLTEELFHESVERCVVRAVNDVGEFVTHSPHQLILEILERVATRFAQADLNFHRNVFHVASSVAHPKNIGPALHPATFGAATHLLKF